jgi:hypothetical protein
VLSQDIGVEVDKQVFEFLYVVSFHVYDECEDVLTLVIDHENQLYFEQISLEIFEGSESNLQQSSVS